MDTDNVNGQSLEHAFKNSPIYTGTYEFVPMNLESEIERTELQSQRRECGWNYDDWYINDWREKMAKREKSLFWIIKPDENRKRVGHISLDSLENSNEPELKNNDKSMMTIKTFFILKGYRGGGLGRVAMDNLEHMATKAPYGSPNCKCIIVDTLCRKYWEIDDDNWRRFYKNKLRGFSPIRASCNEVWYARRGYVKYKEQPQYLEKTLDGEEVRLTASFLKKTLS